MLKLALMLTTAFVVSGVDVIPTFSADRYPTGVEQCSWLNWIADRTAQDDLDHVKEDLIKRVQSLSIKVWESIGNGVIHQPVFDHLAAFVRRNMTCERNRTVVKSCTGLSDIGCQFQDFAANDNSVIFNKTDGAGASPPNHKVVAENDQIRVVNVYCPSGDLETAFHTHTRLSFWLYWGVSRGETYFRYDGQTAFDEPLWDKKEKPTLKVMWNGPEWFHLLREKEAEPYLQQAPGNCPADRAPDCPNGFKYRVELKLDPVLDNYGHSMIRHGPFPSSTVLV
jgi:hypothetical protein